ncbi:MAG: uracil-DNA glycosylase, partial [Hyphomicrobiales bacterium]|nr:uracil-DNA glycosylase [Hyphomicrobiales bacterium]
MSLPDASHDALAAALDFYRHAGVDVAVGERPRNYLAEGQAPAPGPMRGPAAPEPDRRPSAPRPAAPPQVSRPLNPA